MAKFTSIGETIRVKGFDLTARVEHDPRPGEPWKEHDGHGVVSDWTRRDKAPGERVLCEDRGNRRYYDVQASMEIAKRDGWDAEPYGGTAGQKAARAVDADYERMRKWCDDQWHWVGVVISISKNGHTLDNCAASIWGIESDAGDYLVEVANDLIGEAIEAGRSVVQKVTA